MSRLLFEDIFEVLDKDPDGKHFDKGAASELQQATGCVQRHALEHAFAVPVTWLRCAVSRFRCRSDLYEMDLLIDINVDIYPMEVSICLAAAVDSSSPFGKIFLTLCACTGCREVLACAVFHAEPGWDPNRAFI